MATGTSYPEASVARRGGGLAAGRARLVPWRSWLSQPRAGLVIAAAAVLLVTPSLGGGLIFDDLLQQLMLRDDPGLTGLSHRPFDLFRFATGDVVANHALMDEGVFPWWADPRALLSFCRPLSSFTHWLDHRLFPAHPWLMHAHNLIWYGALVLVAGMVYRRIFANAWQAGLALFLYAVDHSHGPAVGWVANRNAIMALALALPALAFHDDWCKRRDRRAAVLGPVFFSLGLLAGEGALVVGAYLVAYAVCLDEGTWPARLRRLLPYIGVVIAWRVVYLALGYGSDRSGLYLDPGHDPLGFLAAVAQRLPILILAAFALPFSDLWDLYPLIAPAARWPVWCLGVGVMCGIVVLFRPLWRRDRSAAFWSSGCLLATLPMCSPFPNDRLLVGTSFGAMAMVALLLGAIADRAYPGSSRALRWAKPAAVGLAVLHVVLAPLMLPFRAHGVTTIDTLLRRADATIPATEDISDQTLVLINPPLDPFADYFPIYRAAARRPRPKHLRWLATGVSALSIERVDAHTLRVRPAAGYLSSSSQLMLRSRRHPLAQGEVVSLTGTTFEVTALTADGRPAEVEVRFSVPLEDPSLRFMQWGDSPNHGYVPFVIPRQGQRVLVPAVDMLDVLRG
jgi:hypothetical protein